MLISQIDTKHLKLLDEFIEMSTTIGSMPDYIQAGGGNTSIKFGDIMAIKCSGCQLKDMTRHFGYTCLPYKYVRKVFLNSNRDTNAEASTSNEINTSVIVFEGLPTKRPSVEAGFHALLGNVVIHTHAIYANVFNCIKDGEKKLADILKPAGIDYLFFNFINPSADLAFTVLDKKSELGAAFPHIIFLKNHGLIVWADTISEAMEYNTKVLETLKNALNLGDYPAVNITDNGDHCISNNKFLNYLLASGKLTKERILNTPLYPDQLVYLNSNLVNSNKIELDDKIIYNTPYNVAYSLEESLLAYEYLLKIADDNGFELECMPESGIQFILGWDAEKYRKQMLK